MIGIYQLTFANKSIYIGQSTNINQRIYQHTWSKGKGSPKLQEAFRLSELISHKILEECTQQELAEKEVYWINKLSPDLNSLPGGPTLSGLNHPRSRYSEEQILEVVRLFSETDATYADISILTEVKSSTVHDICKGRSQVWATNGLDLESIRATRDAKRALTLYSPNNIKYIVDYGDYAKFEKEHNLTDGTLTRFANGTSVKNQAGWSMYLQPTNKYRLTTDEGLEFIDTRDNLIKVMKDCNLPKYSQYRVLDGFISKGWSMKEI